MRTTEDHVHPIFEHVLDIHATWAYGSAHDQEIALLATNCPIEERLALWQLLLLISGGEARTLMKSIAATHDRDASSSAME